MDLAVRRYEQFKTIMDENTDGHRVEIRYGESMTEGLPAIRLFVYWDYPKPSCLTVVTYGLSLANHASWVDEKPELLMRVRSGNDAWIGALGLLADVGRKQGLNFNDGMVLNFNYPIAAPSEMRGLCVGAPAALPVNPLRLEDRRILIRNVFPTYLGEAELISQQGRPQFEQQVEPDRLLDVDRQDLSAGSKMTAAFSENDLLKMITDITTPALVGLARKGFVHDADYSDRGITVVGGNLAGMSKLTFDVVVLLMNSVPKSTVVQTVTPYLKDQGFPAALVGPYIDELHAGVRAVEEICDFPLAFQRHPKLLRLAWFRMTPAEFMAKYGAPGTGKTRAQPTVSKTERPDGVPDKTESKRTVEPKSSRPWWRFWK